jgi:hypothetical protein
MTPSPSSERCAWQARVTSSLTSRRPTTRGVSVPSVYDAARDDHVVADSPGSSGAVAETEARRQPGDSDESPEELEHRPDRRDRLVAIVVVAALAVTALVRLWQITRPGNYLNGDEAVTGLMADRIRHGHLYIFFAGQNYGGAFESYLQALVGGLPLPRTLLSLLIPQLALAVTACWLVFLVGRRLSGSPWWGCFAAFLYAVGPYFNVAKAAESDGFYLSIQLTAIMAVYCALRLGDAGPSKVRWNFLVGLCLGLTVWLSMSGLVVTLPVLLWSLGTLRSWRPALATAAGALLGAAPVIAWTAKNHQLAVPGAGQPPSSYLEHLYVFFRFIVEEFVGVLPRRPEVWIQPPALATAAVVVLLIIATAAIRWRGLRAIVTLRTAQRQPVDLLLLILLITPWLYALSPFAWFRYEPRYVFVLYPVFIWLAVLGAQTLLRLGAVAGRRYPWVNVAARTGFVALTVLWAVLSFAEISRPLARWPATDRQLARAAEWMHLHGVTHAYASYWTALPLNYLSEGGVRVGALGVEQAKMADIEYSVKIAPETAYVHSARPGDPYDFGRLLTSHRVGYAMASIGPVQVYYHLTRQIRPVELGLVDNG